jgi:hypothetical protein
LPAGAAGGSRRRGPSTNRRAALRLALRSSDATTVDTARAPYWDEAIQDVALAFAPTDRCWSSTRSSRRFARRPSRARALLTAPLKLGPASAITRLAAEIGPRGHAIVAWSTMDGGDERNERCRIYAVRGRDRSFGRPQLVHRARHLNISADPRGPIRLAVAPNGRAALLWGTDSGAEFAGHCVVRIAKASPDGPFGRSRVLANGDLSDVAIRSTAGRSPSGPTWPACERGGRHRRDRRGRSVVPPRSRAG